MHVAFHNFFFNFRQWKDKAQFGNSIYAEWQRGLWRTAQVSREVRGGWGGQLETRLHSAQWEGADNAEYWAIYKQHLEGCTSRRHKGHFYHWNKWKGLKVTASEGGQREWKLVFFFPLQTSTPQTMHKPLGQNYRTAATTACRYCRAPLQNDAVIHKFMKNVLGPCTHRGTRKKLWPLWRVGDRTSDGKPLSFSVTLPFKF